MHWHLLRRKKARNECRLCRSNVKVDGRGITCSECKTECMVDLSIESESVK